MMLEYRHDRSYLMYGDDARKAKAHLRKYWKRYVPYQEIIEMHVDKQAKRYIVMTVITK